MNILNFDQKTYDKVTDGHQSVFDVQHFEVPYTYTHTHTVFGVNVDNPFANAI